MTCRPVLLGLVNHRPNYSQRMIVRKGMRFRLYPTPEQAAYIPRISGCVRLAHKLALEQRRMFGRCGRPFRYEGQRTGLKDLTAHADFLREVSHHCLQEALVDLQVSFVRFFKGAAGYPRPHLRRQSDLVHVQLGAGTVMPALRRQSSTFYCDRPITRRIPAWQDDLLNWPKSLTGISAVDRP